MRPLSLTVSGLHSYREPVTVDFEALGRYGLFGIFGPIGSGKSTLLDAITLALFGLVDRTATRSRRGLVHLGSDRCEVRFRVAVSPRAAGGPNEIYEVHRAYRDEDGVAQRVASRLVRLGDDGSSGSPSGSRLVLAEKETEVNAAIEDIVGLGPEDFMRAVVLPQGRFVQLLHLKGHERRLMLQRIFRLQAYGEQLRHKVRDRQAAARSRQAEVRGELAGLGDASPGAVRAAAERAAEVRRERERAEALLLAAEARHEAATRAREQRARWAEARSELKVHLGEEAEIGRARATVQRAARLGPLVEPARRFEEALGRLGKAEEEAREAAAVSEAAARAAGEAELRLTALRLAARDREPELRTRLARLAEAARQQAEIARIAERITAHDAELAELGRAQLEARTTADAARTRATALDRERKRVRREHGKLKVQPEERERVHRASRAADAVDRVRRLVEEARAEELAANGAVLVAQQRVAEAEEELELAHARREACRAALATAEADPAGALDPAVLDERVARAEHARTTRRERASELTAAEQQLRLAEERCAATGAELEAARGELKAASQISRGADRTLADAEQALDLARQRGAAAELARKLGPTLPCPVCGSRHHPSPATPLEGAFEAAVEAHRAGQRRAFDRHQAALTRHAAVEAADRAARGSLDEASARQAAARASLEAVSDGDAHLEVLLAERRAAREARVALARAREAAADAELAWERASGPLFGARATLEASRTEHLRAKGVRESRMNDAGAAWAAFDRDRGELTLFDVKAAVARLEQRDREADVLLARAEELDAEREAAARAADDHRAAADRHLAALERTGERRAEAAARAEELRAQVRAVAGEEDVAEATRRAEAELGGWLAGLAEAEDLAGALRRAAEEASRARAAADAGARGARVELEAARAAIDEVGRALGEVDLTSAAATDEARRARLRELLADLPDPAAVAGLRDRVAGWETRRGWLEGHLRALEDQARGEAPGDEAYAALGEELRRASEVAETTRDAAIAATRTHQDLAARSGRWSELVTSADRTDREISRLDELGQLLRGDRFVEYVANDHLVELTARASEHLAELTSGRYALQLDPDLAFVVRDEDLGGEVRPVHGLSGGESFLTALSLALALSAQVQARSARPLGFFFLDEGFGTLDPESLDRVMTAIERLRSEERLIGLISHVPGIRDRVPRWLSVSRAPGQGSAIELRDG